jgi:hypothetical protein
VTVFRDGEGCRQHEARAVSAASGILRVARNSGGKQSIDTRADNRETDRHGNGEASATNKWRSENIFPKPDSHQGRSIKRVYCVMIIS